MRKKTIGIFLIICFVLFIPGISLLNAGLIGSTTVYNPSTGANDVTSIGNPTLFYTGAIIYILSFVPFLVAWIGALVNLARLKQWGWFVFMLVFNVISLIVYLFAGPETPMRKKTIGIFYIISVVLFIPGISLFIAGLIGSTTVYNPNTGANDVTSLGNPTLFSTGIIIWILSSWLFLVAWIGALINLARLQRWGWFILMFIFNVICLIVYLFAGPETPKVAQYPQYQQPIQNPQNPQPRHHWQD